MEVPKKLKVELSYDSAIPCLGIYLDKNLIQKDTCDPYIHADKALNIALLTIVLYS